MRLHAFSFHAENFRQQVGLRSIAKLPGIQTRVVVYPHIEAQKTEDGIWLMGLSEFSKKLRHGDLF